MFAQSFLRYAFICSTLFLLSGQGMASGDSPADDEPSFEQLDMRLAQSRANLEALREFARVEAEELRKLAAKMEKSEKKEV